MKKILFLLVFSILISSCSEDDITFQRALIPIDEASIPDSFTLNQTETITVSYTLPDDCYNSPRLYYAYQGKARIIAMEALKNIVGPCSNTPSQMELEIPILIQQEHEYLFRLYKGKASNGQNLFEEYIVPVN